MGCPDIYYERFVREADRLITYSWDTDKVTPLKDMEQRILGYKHNSDFYFNCGIAAAHVLDSASEEGNGDAFNAALGGLSEFESLIGNDDEEFCDAYDKQIAKKPLDFGDDAYLCPTCKRNNFYKGDALCKMNFCDWCGQKLDWGGEEENESERNN